MHLCDVGDADDERHQADKQDEDLLPLPQHQGIFIHQSGDEAFHCAELIHPYRKETQVSTYCALLLKEHLSDLVEFHISI